MGTIWTPDTCPPPGCSFDVADWETDSATTIRRCPVHAALPGATHFTEVWRGENQRKNYALAVLLEQAPGLRTDSNGLDDARFFYRWSFDANRVLEAKIEPAPGLPPSQVPSVRTIIDQALTPGVRGNIQTALNARFGAGKVRVL